MSKLVNSDKILKKVLGGIMTDQRIYKLAKGLVNYSCELKKGEKCLIETFDIDNFAGVMKYQRDHGFKLAWVVPTMADHKALWEAMTK